LQAHLQRLLLQSINLLSSQNREGYLEERRLENRLLMAGVVQVIACLIFLMCIILLLSYV